MHAIHHVLERKAALRVVPPMASFSVRTAQSVNPSDCVLESSSRMVRMILTALLSVGAVAAHAAEITGRASVIDGDTIEIRGARIRLSGIDAPESTQTCKNAEGKLYRCGQQAALKLDTFIQDAQPVTCFPVDRDRYGRTVATCQTSQGQDIAAWLVENGLALDWPVYSKGAYERVQDIAMRASSGLWQGDFIVPWEWRKLPKTQRR
jgi:endonuclease YncB( thermonuclease family)